MKNNTAETNREYRPKPSNARQASASSVYTLMKPLMSLTAAFLLPGCSTIPRANLPPGEGHYSWTVRHNLPAEQAFAKTEQALAESYHNLPRVMVLRQPESGTFILHPLIGYSVAAIQSDDAYYNLKVVVGGETVTLDFELGRSLHGAWPPPSALPGIKSSFKGIATRVAQAVGGTLE